MSKKHDDQDAQSPAKPLSLRKQTLKVLKVQTDVHAGRPNLRWCGNYTMSQVREGC